LRELTFGKTVWLDLDYEPDTDYPMVQANVPGLFRLKFPPLAGSVQEIQELVLSIASPFIQSGKQITLLIDGLDRLIQPERFREFAEQDLQALRGTKISVIVVGPLLLWYDKSRFLQDYFDVVKHIPAAAAGPQDLAFLRRILERRGALNLMDPREVASIAKYSSGVLRDLLTLARSSAEYAYLDDKDRIGRRHVNAAITQLGNRYLVGLGNAHKALLRRLAKDGAFPVENANARELLVNRQVLEYFADGREFFAVHRALANVLPKP